MGPKEKDFWSSGIWNDTPHGGEERLFLKDLHLLWEMPFEFRGVLKAWDPKKWVMWPQGFAMITNTTVSSLFFKKDYFSCRRCPLGSGGFVRLWNLKNGLCGLWALEWYPTRLSVASFSKQIISPPAGDALWVEWTSVRCGTPRNILLSLWDLQ